jgi:hypothetical protein
MSVLSLQNAVYFIMIPCWFLYYLHFKYIVLKFKNSGAKFLMCLSLIVGVEPSYI